MPHWPSAHSNGGVIKPPSQVPTVSEIDTGRHAIRCVRPECHGDFRVGREPSRDSLVFILRRKACGLLIQAPPRSRVRGVCYTGVHAQTGANGRRLDAGPSIVRRSRERATLVTPPRRPAARLNCGTQRRSSGTALRTLTRSRKTEGASQSTLSVYTSQPFRTSTRYTAFRLTGNLS
jgi:hypothetical protein